MGWAYCGVNRDTGDEMGYGVIGVCAEPGCTAEIDHGLSYLCGEMHEDSETCSRYFCPEHLYFNRCRVCNETNPKYPEDEDEASVGANEVNQHDGG